MRFDEQLAALGRLPGVYTVNKFGRNADIDTATDPETIWEGSGLYSYPSGAQVIQVASSSTDDDGDPAGTGARTLRIEGVDSSFELAGETITMDGSATVETSTSFRRVFRAYVATAGSGGTNAGNITLTYKAAATTAATITAGNSQTLMAIYTVPSGYTALLTNYYATINRNAANPAGAHARISIYERPNASGAAPVLQLKHIVGLGVDGSGSAAHTFTPYRKILGPTDIEIRASDVSDNDTDISAGFDLIVIDNDILDSMF